MSAIEPLCHLIGVDPNTLTKEENILLEIELFTRICEELMEVFREQNREYFRLMKFTIEKENKMLESKFIHSIIQDILSTQAYNLQGIAYYTDSHEDVIQEVYTGQNQSPSATLLRKIVELHRVVRYELYMQITKKIISKYLAAE